MKQFIWKGIAIILGVGIVAWVVVMGDLDEYKFKSAPGIKSKTTASLPASVKRNDNLSKIDSLSKGLEELANAKKNLNSSESLRLQQQVLIKLLEITAPADVPALIDAVRTEAADLAFAVFLDVALSKALFDREALQSWVKNKLPDTAESHGIMYKLGWVWSSWQSDSIEDLLSSLPVQTVRGRALAEGYCNALARTGIENAMGEANRLFGNGVSKLAAEGMVDTAISTKQYEGLLQALQADASWPNRKNAIASTISSAASENLDQAKMLIAGIQTEELVAPAVTGLVNQWSRSDVRACSEWLNTLDKGVPYDLGAAALAKNLSTSAPSDAGVWVASIADERIRGNAVQTLYSEWSTRDLQSADAWIETNGLSQYLRRK